MVERALAGGGDAGRGGHRRGGHRPALGAPAGPGDRSAPRSRGRAASSSPRSSGTTAAGAPRVISHLAQAGVAVTAPPARGQPARRHAHPLQPAARGRRSSRPRSASSTAARAPASTDDHGPGGDADARPAAHRLDRDALHHRAHRDASPSGRRSRGASPAAPTPWSTGPRSSRGCTPRTASSAEVYNGDTDAEQAHRRRHHPRRAGAPRCSAAARPTPRAPGWPWSRRTNDILRDRGLALQAIACLDTAIWDVFARGARAAAPPRLGLRHGLAAR